MSTKITPNRAEAERFLNLIEPGGDFWFQTQLEPRPPGRGRPNILRGTLDQVWTRLVGLNAQHHAIWVQINAATGRKDDEVFRLRGYFVDIDDGDGSLLLNSPEQPDIIVETSPGKYHGHWRTKGGPLDEFKSRQLALAARFGGDTTVCNLGRVMRLPGFVHWKGEPFLSHIMRVRAGL
ncbi:MAG: hypothetical protein IPF94_06425 [Betaproteobacteria bacterium]|nr:hypothetical protein [Betaproteobacteria bacterium]